MIKTMTEEVKQKLKYWLIGLFTGGAIAAPITGYICKNVYDKKVDEAETRGMNAMAQYVVEEVNELPKEARTLTEEDYAEKEDIKNYDVSIDPEEEEGNDIAKERTEAHERYLDMIEKYNGSLDMIPYVIDGEQFINEAYMEKAYVNWYEEDDIFEEDLQRIEDPFATFGVTSGTELFRYADMRPDPDIVYVRNEKVSTDFEISRIHGSYAKMVGGEASLGETDT